MNKVLMTLIILAVILFPLDVNILVNKILGMGTHIILYMILIGVILYLIKGRTLKEKISNIKKALKW